MMTLDSTWLLSSSWSSKTLPKRLILTNVGVQCSHKSQAKTEKRLFIETNLEIFLTVENDFNLSPAPSEGTSVAGLLIRLWKVDIIDYFENISSR